MYFIETYNRHQLVQHCTELEDLGQDLAVPKNSQRKKNKIENQIEIMRSLHKWPISKQLKWRRVIFLHGDFFLLFRFVSFRSFFDVHFFRCWIFDGDVCNPNTSFNCFMKRIHPKLAATEILRRFCLCFDRNSSKILLFISMHKWHCPFSKRPKRES